MNKITVIPYPITTEYEDSAILRYIDHEMRLPPLGPLVVAALARESCDADVDVLDINRAYLEHVDAGRPTSTFCEELAKQLAASETELFAFSSICSSFHVTLHIIENLKRLRSDAIILLGGPQASSTAAQTMSCFSSVDFILVGEVEKSLGTFLANYKSAPESVPGLVWRSTDGTTRSNPPAPVPAVDELRQPALDLWDMTGIRTLPLEAGRGCAFNCKFCSTSIHFGRRYRLKTADQLVAEFKQLKNAHSCRAVSFTHDNMFCSVKHLRRFCSAWMGDPVTADVPWACSLRSDFITQEVVDLLAKSGCMGVFIGVESGSADMQQVINKKLDVEQVRKAVRLLDDAGVSATLAFIVGFPEETAADFSKTMELYDWVLQRRHTKPQLGMLSPLAGSQYLEEYKDVISFTQRYSDMAHQGDALSADFQRTLRAYPELFSAHYALPVQHWDVETLSAIIEFLKYAIARFRWLLVLTALGVGGLERLLNEWLAFKGIASSLAEETNYYGGHEFQWEFICFCEALAKRKDFLCEIEPQFDAMIGAYTIEEKDLEFLEKIESTAATSAPNDDLLISMGVVREVGYSFRDMVDAIAEFGTVTTVPPSTCYVLIEKVNDAITVQEVSALTARIVELFAGGAKKQAVVEELMSANPSLMPEGVAHKAAGFAFAIDTLAERGTLTRLAADMAKVA